MLDQKFIWQPYIALQSATTTQHLLHTCYKKLGVEDAEKKSYENSYPFIYYLEHGQSYYQLASQASLSIKPVLLFYGMVQLLKACLLTVDPQYPESTSVLAHGVSTRKRKKQGYEFLQDEVKVQKNGLFTHFSDKMFHVKHFEAEKFAMDRLLKNIPELNNLFLLHYQKEPSIKAIEAPKQPLCLPIGLLDAFHMTLGRFENYIKETLPDLILKPEHDNQEHKSQITFMLESGTNLAPLNCSPLLYHMYEESYYFPKDREQIMIFPEVMVHYLLLYNLSMISRYETEWWSELLHSYSSNDYPFIQQFISVTSDKIPYLLYQFLKEKIVP